MARPTKFWPSWRYGPNGTAAIFESEDKVPVGWEDHPGKVRDPERPPPPPPDPPVLPLTRSEIIAQLRRLGISFQQRSATRALYDLYIAELES